MFQKKNILLMTIVFFLMAKIFSEAHKTPRNWPYGMVFYHLDKDFTNYGKKQILKAFKHIEKHTCIRFRHVSNSIYESRIAKNRYAFIFRSFEKLCGST